MPITVLLLTCLSTVQGADEVRVRNVPSMAPFAVETLVPATLANPELEISLSGSISVRELHWLGGISLGTCSTLFVKLIDLPFAGPPDPTGAILVMAAANLGFSVGLVFGRLVFPESSKMFSEVMFLVARRPPYIIRFNSPGARTRTRENLKNLPAHLERQRYVPSVRAVLTCDAEWICHSAVLRTYGETVDLFSEHN